MVKRIVTTGAAIALLLGIASAAPAQDWGYGPTPRDGACFYKDTKFHGEFFCVESGDSIRHMPDGMNDKITSIRLFGSGFRLGLDDNGRPLAGHERGDFRQ